MDKELTIYLEDHLAMIVGEMELAERCRNQNPASELARHLEQQLADTQVQRAAAEAILHQLQPNVSLPGQLKQGALWAAEKLGRLKTNGSMTSYSKLSRVVELEALTLAATERVFLWESLGLITHDPRFVDIPAGKMLEAAQGHVKELSRFRLAAGRVCFHSTS